MGRFHALPAAKKLLVLAQWGLAVVLAVVPLALRIVHRGPYYPGWDVLWAAQGQSLIATGSWRAVATWVSGHHHSLTLHPSTLLPGLLAYWLPWEGWGSVIDIGYTLASFALVGLGLRLQEGWVVLLAWGCSGALLSWAVAGHPVVTCFWPHAIALAIVLRLERRPILSGVLLYLTALLAWHCYEQGRSMFLVPVLAALVERGLPWPTRAVWLGVGLVSGWDVMAHQTSNQARFLHWQGFDALVPAATGLAALLPRLDTLGLLVLGVVGWIGVKRHATLLRLLYLAQVGFVLLLALESPLAVIPRRFLMLPFFSLVLLVAVWVDRPRWRIGLLAGLLAGNAWQLRDTAEFVRQPLDPHGSGYGWTLPYVWATVDYMVPYGLVDAYEDMARDLDQGKNLVLIYNLDAFEENCTNPMGLIHRLYLHVGDARWRERVHVYGTTRCVLENCVPIEPMEAVSELGRLDPAGVAAYAISSPNDPPLFQEQAAVIMGVLTAHFQVETTTSRTTHGAFVHRLTLTPKAA